jgi:hypothetical protein
MIANSRPHIFSEAEKNSLLLFSHEAGNVIQNAFSKIDLRSRSEELEKLNKLSIGRELKMIELKEKIIELESKIASLDNLKNGSVLRDNPVSITDHVSKGSSVSKKVLKNKNIK